MTEMTLHRALAQRKTTKARINNELENIKTRFIAITVGTRGVVDGEPIADVEASIKGTYDKIMALIDNFDSLNAAITAANAGVTSKTSDIAKIKLDFLEKEVTLADIIQLKESMKFRRKLLTVMSNQLVRATMSINQAQVTVDQRCDTMLSGMKNGNDTSTSKADLDAMVKTFHENNDYKMVDPLHLGTLIKEMKDKLDAADVEIDSKNSELNALTKITVDI